MWVGNRPPPTIVLTTSIVACMFKSAPKNYLKDYDSNKHIIKAKRNCNYCYGRGYVGRNITNGGVQQCTCLRLLELKNSDKERYGEITTESGDPKTSQTLSIKESTVDGDN